MRYRSERVTTTIVVKTSQPTRERTQRSAKFEERGGIGTVVWGNDVTVRLGVRGRRREVGCFEREWFSWFRDDSARAKRSSAEGERGESEGE